MHSLNQDRDHISIGEFFRLRKLEVERNAPAFETLWSQAQSRANAVRRLRGPLRIVWAAAAVAGAVAFAFLLPMLSNRETDRVKLGILEWQSPTAVLLRPMNAEFLTGMPKLGKPLFDMKLNNPESH
ncbi:MAG: hypothetical protein HYY49_10370 [Ignavibacteriales bacterium]|nr:hypothetical protein [Ignavibacteriales bacterium]